MGMVNIACPGAQKLAKRLRYMGDGMALALGPANLAIADSMRTTINGRYGKVAKYWKIETGPTSVRIWADDRKVYWWEFGTPPHGINPVNGKMLRFTPAGATGPVFARHVNHPGTKAHNQRGPILSLLKEFSRAEWQGAIATLLKTTK